MKTAFIAWQAYHRRAEILAQQFAAGLHFVSEGQRGGALQTLVRYLRQGWQTWQIMRRKRPDVVFVQNPPIFAVLAVFFYTRRHGARYIIDSHTGAFLSPRWRWSLGLHRMLSRRALTTIVHNKSQEKIVQHWGCRYCVIAFTPGDYSLREDFPIKGKFNVAVISTGSEDEPLAAVFEAAGQLPDVHFYITGNLRWIHQNLLSKKPINCHLTGYLSYGQYIGLLHGVDAVMDLTTRDHTLLMGGFEAVSLGTPLITSDWPVLKDYFSLGTVHVSNTVEGIWEGIRRVQSDRDVLRSEMQQLRNRLQGEWEQNFKELQHLINEH